MNHLAIIIPFYKGEQFIERCVESLEGYPSKKIIIVDNSPNKLNIKLQAKVIRTESSKIGFGAAVNFGFRYLVKNKKTDQYKHILILNQDAFFQKGHFNKLIDYLSNHKLEKFASPMVYVDNFIEVMPFIKERYFSNGNPTSIIDIKDFVAVSLIVPFVLMKKLKGFDEQFFMYYEDNDLIARSKINKAVRILPQIHVGHHNPDLEEVSPVNKEKQKWIRESRLKYLYRHESIFRWSYEYFKYYLKSIIKK